MKLGCFVKLGRGILAPRELREYNPRGVILSGGPESVTGGDSAPRAPTALFQMGVPLLGICYGMQTMASQLGGRVDTSDIREFGYAQVVVEGPSPLLKDITDHVGADGDSLLDVWMSHGDKVGRDARRFRADGVHRFLPDRWYGRQ